MKGRYLVVYRNSMVMHSRCLTVASALDLAAAEQRVVDEVRQAAVEVHGGQAALEALAGHHQLGQVLVHVGPKASHKQITCRRGTGGTEEERERSMTQGWLM